MTSAGAFVALQACWGRVCAVAQCSGEGPECHVFQYQAIDLPITQLAPHTTISTPQLKPYVSGKAIPQGKRVPDWASMAAAAGAGATGGQAGNGSKDELR